MGINAVKGVEIGAGFACVTAKGSDFVDPILPTGFASNNAGGILAGISTGQDITARLAFKPASSIRIPTATIDHNNCATEISTTGRHDPCVALRAAPIVEAMAAIVLLDHLLRHRGQNGYLR
jgi:chorismate synthase